MTSRRAARARVPDGADHLELEHRDAVAEVVERQALEDDMGEPR